MRKKKQLKCEKCGKIIKKEMDICTPDRYSYIEERGYKIICGKCWDEIARMEEDMEKCCLCGRQEYNDNMRYFNYFILSKKEAKEQGMKAGYYKILDYPFYDDDCISQTIREYCVKKLFDLNGKEYLDEGNRVCTLQCIKNFLKQKK